ncbi:MAG: winged helix-turn-helix domain-containing protein, partial [Tardiphaga sp.]
MRGTRAVDVRVAGEAINLAKPVGIAVSVRKNRTPKILRGARPLIEQQAPADFASMHHSEWMRELLYGVRPGLPAGTIQVAGFQLAPEKTKSVADGQRPQTRQRVSLAGMHLERTSAVALHQQIATHLRSGILRGIFPAGTQFLGSRETARELGCSRTVILTAWELLYAEGYLESTPRGGVSVASVNQTQA